MKFSQLASLCTLNVCNLKEKAMKSFNTLVATTILVALPNIAAAAPRNSSSSEPTTPPAPPPPAATATGSVGLGTSTPPTASGSASATTPPAPKPASAFMFQTTTQGFSTYQYMVGHVSGIGVDWAGNVDKETIARALGKVTDGDQKTAAGKVLSQVQEGALRVFQYIREKPLDRTAFYAYLKANGCEPVMDGDKVKRDVGNREIWTEGCKAFGQKLAPLVTAAIAASKADATVKSNATFTLSKALPLMEGLEGAVVRGGDAIALIHLAALDLPFGEWAKAYGLTDDLNANPLIGKDVCVTKRDGTMVCGKIEKVENDGVTVNGEKIPFDQLLSICFDTKEKCEAKGGSASSEGFMIQGSAEYIGVVTQGQSNLHLMTAGVDVGYQFKVPLYVFAGLAFMTSPGGAVAKHYSQLLEGSDRMDLVVRAGAGYRPMFGKVGGLDVHVTGMVTSSGGGGAFASVGPVIKPAPDSAPGFAIIPYATAGGFDWGQTGGSNPTSAQGSLPVRGFAGGGGLSLSGVF